MSILSLDYDATPGSIKHRVSVRFVDPNTVIMAVVRPALRKHVGSFPQSSVGG